MSSGGFLRLNSEKWLVAQGPWKRREAKKEDGSYFYCPDFFLEGLEIPWIPEKWQILSTTDLPAAAALPALVWQDGDKESFFKTHAEVLAGIRRGDFQKMVPFTEFYAEGRFDPFSLMQRMSALPANLFPYGFWNHDGVTSGMVGATPELLYYRKGSLLKTMALAGTAPLDNEEKLNTVKERDEHQIVIDGLREVLSGFGEVRVGETKIVRYTALCHLKTEIEVELRGDVKDENLIRALHPTAALGGWPREVARQWHASHELSRGRGQFGAPMLVKKDDEVWVLVLIRGIQWRASDLCLRVGCGVVEGSEAESEWNELLLKKRATLRGLGFSNT